MMLPTDAAMTTRRSSLSGTFAALIGLPYGRGSLPSWADLLGCGGGALRPKAVTLDRVIPECLPGGKSLMSAASGVSERPDGRGSGRPGGAAGGQPVVGHAHERGDVEDRAAGLALDVGGV